MRIAIVDDRPLAREALRRAVSSTAEHVVAWMASDGAEAVSHTRRDLPDLILMDLIMPQVDGVEATRRIMAETPCPILIVTATVSGNLGKVYEAMGHGALDAVDTPTLSNEGLLLGDNALLRKIRTIGKLIGKISPRIEPARPAPARSVLPRTDEVLIAIGSSTGGPNALAEVLTAFPKAWKPTVVMIQHVDVAFSQGLVRWLGERTQHVVEVAQEGQRPRPGQILLAATNDHLVLDGDNRFHYVEEPRALSYRPSVDVFFESLKRAGREPGVAVLLTGMGRDGASGMLSLRRAGWFTLAQDRETSVVWGMPGAAVELGAACKVLPIHEIGPAVVDHVKSRCSHTPEVGS